MSTHRSRGIDSSDASPVDLSRRRIMIVSLRLPDTSSSVPMPPASGDVGSAPALLSEPTSRKFSTIALGGLSTSATPGMRSTESMVVAGGDQHAGRAEHADHAPSWPACREAADGDATAGRRRRRARTEGSGAPRRAGTRRVTMRDARHAATRAPDRVTRWRSVARSSRAGGRRRRCRSGG